jgi:DNA polymerase-3 subunit chi
MTEITFHLNAQEKLDYSCRLIRKAYNAKAKVVVAGPSDLLSQLSALLWSLSSTDFIAHCHLDPAAESLSAAHSSYMLAASPVVLTASILAIDKLPHHQVLLNFFEDVAPGFEKFERVIEIVGQAEPDKEMARKRWRHYAQRGYPIQKHDIQ